MTRQTALATASDNVSLRNDAKILDGLPKDDMFGTPRKKALPLQFIKVTDGDESELSSMQLSVRSL
jgi:hypothetical protein